VDNLGKNWGKAVDKLGIMDKFGTPRAKTTKLSLALEILEILKSLKSPLKNLQFGQFVHKNSKNGQFVIKKL
jgi:hypothetical protein